MTDLRDRFRSLDLGEGPDLWREIEQRAAHAPAGSRGYSLFAALTVVAAAVLIIALGIASLLRQTNVGPAPSPQVVITPAPTSYEHGRWSTTAPMLFDHGDHSATLLADGRVLVAGGSMGAEASAIVELYDPTTRTWTQVGSMRQARLAHSATLLRDGRVLVVGGSVDNTPLGSAEIFDPATGDWTTTSPMVEPHGSGHTATLLPDGRVLVAGGYQGAPRSSPTDSVELYDPASDTWTAAEPMSRGRAFFTSTLLPDGTVLAAGGLSSLNSADLYDPSTDAWRTVGAMADGRHDFTATLLADGTVLVVGGEMVSSAEAYDPRSRTWNPVASTAGAYRGGHSATLLPDGSVLLVGGVFSDPEMVTLYDPNTGTWTRLEDLDAGFGHSTTLLGDGTVLVTGIASDPTSAMVYRP